MTRSRMSVSEKGKQWAKEEREEREEGEKKAQWTVQ